MITAREDVLNFRFDHSDTSNNNSMGMRELQSRVYEKRNAQYLLIKAPPASGKSRALMYVALDKVYHQGCTKVIIAVPQMSIGNSFSSTDLTSAGFWCDWEIDPKYNLCDTSVTDQQKVKTVNKFIADPEAHFLLCTHPTLIFFYDQLKDKSVLNQALIAVDEFHHVSVDRDNRLGSVLHSLMKNTSAHIVAMTGSYFRGDSVPVLEPQDEELFDKVTYTYYEQLKSYKYLKSLGLDYAFYSGIWTDAVHDILDTTKKTMIFLPHVTSHESTGKYDEVGKLRDVMGKVVVNDKDKGICTLQTPDGRLLKVADLVDDQTPGLQKRTLDYLRHVRADKDAIDIIIALNMAKEGFDWPWCEQVLTIGYRKSLTEVVQIIGRTTRDAPGKEHAQYTNLIAKPDAEQSDVANAVNSLLKAISLSLLMEQVLVPNVHFRVRRDKDDEPQSQPQSQPHPQGSSEGDEESMQDHLIITINDDEKAPLSPAVKAILEGGVSSIVEQLVNSEPIMSESIFSDGQGINELLWNKSIPQVISKMFASLDLSDSDIATISSAVLAQLNIPAVLKKFIAETKEQQAAAKDAGTDANAGSGGNGGSSANSEQQQHSSDDAGSNSKQRRTHNEVVIDNNALLKFSEKFINVDDLDINLILAINPFQDAHDFISRNLDAATFHAIQDQVLAKRAQVSEEEACLLWPALNKFIVEHKREPNPHSVNDFEKRLAEVYAYLRRKKEQQLRAQAATSSTTTNTTTTTTKV